MSELDTCLGSTENAGEPLHYHAASPCLIDTSLGNTDCANDGTCSTDISTYISDAWAGNEALTVVGVAKDGHLIYGPYKDNGNAYGCVLDICNGVYLADGDYGYISSLTFPYTVGCFGPGGYEYHSPSCTLNPKSLDCGLHTTAFNILVSTATVLFSTIFLIM